MLVSARSLEGAMKATPIGAGNSFTVERAYDGVYEYFSDGRPTEVVVDNKYYNVEPLTPPALKLPADKLMIDESLRKYKIDPPTSLFNKAAAENNINDGIFSDIEGGKPTHAVYYGKFYSLTPR